MCLIIIGISVSAVSAQQHSKKDTSKPVLPHQADDLHGAGLAYAQIRFKFDSSILDSGSYPALDATAGDLKSSGAAAELDGYTSSEGSAAHNMRLARDRANAVKTYLVNSGVDPRKLKVKAYGETHPLADNSTEDGRVMNRRVEIKKLSGKE